MAKSNRTKVHEIKELFEGYGSENLTLDNGTYLIKEIQKIIDYK